MRLSSGLCNCIERLVLCAHGRIRGLPRLRRRCTLQSSALVALRVIVCRVAGASSFRCISFIILLSKLTKAKQTQVNSALGALVSTPTLLFIIHQTSLGESSFRLLSASDATHQLTVDLTPQFIFTASRHRATYCTNRRWASYLLFIYRRLASSSWLKLGFIYLH